MATVTITHVMNGYYYVDMHWIPEPEERGFGLRAPDPAPMAPTTPTGAMAGKIQAPFELRAGKRRGGSGPKGATRR